MLRRKIACVDAVLRVMDARGAFGRQRPEQLRLGRRHEDARFGRSGHRALEGKQARALALEDGRQRPRPGLRILAPFRRIHVDEIHDGLQPRQLQRVRGHRGREHDRPLDPLFTHDRADPFGERSVAVVPERHCFAGEEAREAADAGEGRPQLDHLRRCAVLLQPRYVHQVLGAVDEGAKVNPIARRQEFEQMERSHLVPLVRGKRNSMDEKQKGFHRDAIQPRFRTMCGPRTLTTGSGSLRQIAISILYFGLRGLF